MRMSRRGALKSASVLAGAGLLGCTGAEGGSDGGTAHDSAVPGTDARVGRDAGPPPTGPFQHGVASGDPLVDRVILWTRISEASGAVMVTWEIASDPGFTSIVASGEATTDAERDYTVKVDASGLGAGTTYYYRFRLGDDESPIGRTRTAPSGPTARLRAVVCSCSSYSHGYFHLYRDVAQRADLDLVIHLGDYIYEYGNGTFGGFRELDPPNECVSLSDYRRRYAHYRTDRDLQEAHRQHPFVCVWDDHETCNDAWREGGQNHMPDTEGSYAERQAAAARAYREWLPIRESTEADRRIYRTLPMGDLAELVMLDTRIIGRDESATGVDDPTLASETRQLLGEAQEAWLRDTLVASTARWKLLGQQVMMGQLPSIPNMDAWDGFPAQRARILSFIEERGIEDVVVLTGDIHCSWALEVAADPFDATAYDPETGRGALAVEVVCPGIGSPSILALAGRALERQVAEECPHVKWMELYDFGYALLDITHERVQAAWYLTGETRDPEGADIRMAAAFSVATGTAHLVPDEAAASPPASPPELAPQA